MKERNSALWTGMALSIAGMATLAAGCELVAGIDRGQIDQGDTSSSSSSSSSNSGGMAGAGGGGMGGAAGMGGMGGVGGMGGTGGMGGMAGMGGMGGTAGMGGMGGAGGMGGTAGMGGGGAGGGPVCTVPGDCMPSGNECVTVDCVMGACVPKNVALNTPTTGGQTAGDCKEVVCDGNGGTTTRPLNTDTMNDNKDCTQDTCSNGTPTFTPVALGMVCDDNGGKFCNATGVCVECNTGANCMSGVCQTNMCQAAQCGDMVKNGMETDVDCGGGMCGACADTKMCMMGSDCISQVCMGGTCAAPSCTDTKKNGTETDVDCGGMCPSDCMDGKMCGNNNDCVSGFCNPMTNLCAAPTCMDMFQNGMETDTDCGGPTCPDCMNGDSCVMTSDCASGFCNPMTMMCAAPTCTDMFQNGSETDTDCGGPTCPDCMNGDTCMGNGDCTSGYCNASMTCAAPTCTDMVQNGMETDTDCGGPTCPDCMNGDTCIANGDCTSGFCNTMTNVCAAPTCTDMFQNGMETDTDCGGGTCPTCANGDTCTNNSDCMSGMCYGGLCVASVNGCDIATATDYTVTAPPPITFANGNFTYAPKCIKVKVGTVLTFNGNFANHPTTGGQVVGAVATPATSGPFIPVTNTGTTKNFTMNAVGTFPYYCQPHATIGMNAAVFVVP